MRKVLAVAAGGVTALVTYWGGAVITLVLSRGMPLGSTGSPPTRPDLAAHLGLGALACFLGATLTIRMATTSPMFHAGVLALLLGAGAVLSFGKPSSQWPAWFGFAMAAICLLAVVTAALLARVRGRT